MSGYTFITESGAFVPDTSDLLSEVESEWKSAFGQDLTVTPDTPQGVMIAAEVLAREGTLKNICQAVNQINPNIAEGIFLDAIWALTGGRRIPASKTLVEGVVLTGVPSSIIPAGSIAATSDTGAQFALTSNIVLDNAGVGVGNFEAVESGQIACDANTLTIIVTASIGWETVTNPTAQAVLGTDLESDELSRTRRRNTLAAQAVTPSEAIISGLYGLVGVKSVAYRENVKNTVEVIDGVTMEPHSVWACVDGASDDDVARVLLSKKSCGANWNGAVSVNVTDPWSGQVYPVQFDRPTEVQCMVRVTVRSAGGVADPIGTVRKAIMDYQAGLVSSESGLTLGVPLSAFELAGAVNQVEPLIFVRQVEVALLSVTPTWVTILPIEIWEKAVIDESDIAVTVA